jgi:hypothetical protein
MYHNLNYNDLEQLHHHQYVPETGKIGSRRYE